MSKGSNNSSSTKSAVPVGFGREAEKLEGRVIVGGLYKRKDADNDDDRNDQSFKTPNSIF
jgi:hypothetical protein